MRLLTRRRPVAASPGPARKSRAGPGHTERVEPKSDRERREGFEGVVASVYPSLRRYLLRRADPATADDVLGDVLLVMWRRANEIPADAPLPWCYGVARGCLANSRRGAERHLRLVRRLAATAPAAPASASDDPELEAALGALGAGDREILRLWAWEGLAPREMAVALGITPNAASIRLHRATSRLRSRYGSRLDEKAAGRSGEPHETEAPR